MVLFLTDFYPYDELSLNFHLLQEIFDEFHPRVGYVFLPLDFAKILPKLKHSADFLVPECNGCDMKFESKHPPSSQQKAQNGNRNSIRTRLDRFMIDKRHFECPNTSDKYCPFPPTFEIVSCRRCQQIGNTIVNAFCCFNRR